MNHSSLIHNVSALNSNRFYGTTYKNSIQSSMRLSSGQKINRAKDDACGLSISEKLRKHTGGLTSAVYNTQTGVSLLQVADGALQEVHDILQRTNELAVQAANGIYSDQERSMLQDEIEESLKEIDRIGNSTIFNGMYLFKNDEDQIPLGPVAPNPTPPGSSPVPPGSTAPVPTPPGSGSSPAPNPITESFDFKGNTFYLLNSNVALTEEEAKEAIRKGNDIYVTPMGPTSQTIHRNIWRIDVANPSASEIFTAVEFNDKSGNTHSLANIVLGIKIWGDWNHFVNKVNETFSKDDYYFMLNGNALDFVYTGIDNSKDIDSFSVSYVSGFSTKNLTGYNSGTRDVTVPVTPAPQTKAEIGTHYDYTPAINNTSASNFASVAPVAAPVNMNQPVTSSEKQFHLLLGAESGQNMILKLKSLSREYLGLSDLSVSSEDAATTAIQKISDAIDIISKQRSYIGAIDNRLGHTVKSLNNTIENLTAAYSKIRDTDMAKEAIVNANENILAKFDESMLAQANQKNQGTVTLLQGAVY